MEHRWIGNLSVSVIGLGCNNFGTRIDESATRKVVYSALEAGITLFDTADIYDAGHGEELLGKALGSSRDEVVIATKFGYGDGTSLPAGASAASVAASLEGSLRRLGTDRIDLYQLHRPDDVVEIDETLGALNRLVGEGKIREIGASNFGAAKLDQAAQSAEHKGTARFVCVENEFNLLQRRGEADLFATCERHDLAILPFYPLANGLLTGKYQRGEDPQDGTRLANMPAERRDQILNDRNFQRVEALESFARARSHSLLELAMSWLAGLPRIASVIAGATNPEQVRANAKSVNWTLSDDERAEIDLLCPPD